MRKSYRSKKSKTKIEEVDFTCRKLGHQFGVASKETIVFIQKVESFTEQTGYIFTQQRVADCESKNVCGIKRTYPGGAIDYDWNSCEACPIFNKSGSL